MSKQISVGMFLFPQATFLDFVGPYEVFTRVPQFKVFSVAKSLDLLVVEGGLHIKADYSFKNCPPIDILFVPGGFGVNDALEDEETLRFLTKVGESAKFKTSVCTGSLLLGAAGLLQGRRATTHWRYTDLLALLGATFVDQRVVFDSDCITGGGVTAGIDFGLALVAKLVSEEQAKRIQLYLEYDPHPPFDSGSPSKADPALLERVINQTAENFAKRKSILERIQSKLGRNQPTS